MGRILIQPMLNTLAEYDSFAAQHDFDFEIVDFAFPNTLAGDYEPEVEAYREYAGLDRCISQHGAFMDLYINSPDPGIRELAWQRIEANLNIAQALDIQYVVFHTNRLSQVLHPAYTERWIKMHAEVWQEMLAHYPGVTVLLENMWDSSPEPVAAVLDAVNSDRLGVCFDTGHWNLFSEASMEDWFERLGARIAYIHLNDNRGDIDDESPAGQGSIDWRHFGQMVERYLDQPHVVLEVGDLTRIQTTMDYLTGQGVYPFA